MTYEKILDALGDPTRRQIFERLSGSEPSSVAVLAAGLPISRPAVSQHLKVLKQAGLVRNEAMGVRRLYRLDRRGLAALRAWIDCLDDAAVDAYRAEIQRQLDERRHT